jgi:osmoprotectant transport system substrate-binding protein
MRYPPFPMIWDKLFKKKALILRLGAGQRVGAEVAIGDAPLSRVNFCQVRRRSAGTGAWGRLSFLGSLLALAGVQLLVACAPPRSGRVVIGAKNFTEQVVLGELLAQEIESVGGRPVGRRFYLAGSYLCQQALVSGRIDGYVEYTGTALTAILKQPLPPPGERDPARVFGTVERLYKERYGVRVEQGLGFEDTFAMVVRGEDARRLGVKTISDAVRVSEPMSQSRDMGRPDSRLDSRPSLSPDTNLDQGASPAMVWRLGVGYEFEERPDGLRGLEAAYGLRFAGAPRTMDLGLLYRALAGGQVDMVAGNSTDGPIRALGFAVLEDDRHYFPPYEAVPLVREDSLRRHPEMQVAFDKLAGKVTAEAVREMNDAVDGQHRDVGEVVREFRQRMGL